MKRFAMRSMLLAALAVHSAATTAAAEPVLLWQNGFESADTCAWSAAIPSAACDPEMVFVPEGAFWMGSDFLYTFEQPIHSVTLDAFWIDRTEVTLDQYAACVAASQCPIPEGSYVPPPSGTALCNWGAPWNPGSHPINCVSWPGAEAFCAWAGKRLPTEAEWEKAARGGDERTYPWGEQTPTCDYAVMYQLDLGQGCGEVHTMPVGTRPAGMSPYGAYDMGGNVQEWAHDWYFADYYGGSPPSNPTGPASGTQRVLRGGRWSSPSAFIFRTGARYADPPPFWSDILGFRCARDG